MGRFAARPRSGLHTTLPVIDTDNVLHRPPLNEGTIRTTLPKLNSFFQHRPQVVSIRLGPAKSYERAFFDTRPYEKSYEYETVSYLFCCNGLKLWWQHLYTHLNLSVKSELKINNVQIVRGTVRPRRCGLVRSLTRAGRSRAKR